MILIPQSNPLLLAPDLLPWPGFTDGTHMLLLIWYFGSMCYITFCYYTALNSHIHVLIVIHSHCHSPQILWALGIQQCIVLSLYGSVSWGPEDDSVRVETCSPAVTLYVLYLLLLCLTDTFCPLYSINILGWKTSNLKLRLGKNFILHWIESTQLEDPLSTSHRPLVEKQCVTPLILEETNFWKH